MSQSTLGVEAASLDAASAHHMESVLFEGLPASSIDATKCCILDTLGAMLAGWDADGCREVRALVQRWGGAGESRIPGSAVRVPAHNAALVAATMARALEVDDVHERALLHSTATLVPVALACADAHPGADGQDLIAAVAAGIDLAARLSLAPEVDIGVNHRPRGMSWTYQTGMMVGSLVAGRMAGHDEAALRNILGVAYSQCAGNNQCLLEGALTVRVQQGLSASAALMSLALHESGISGTHESLSGALGYFNTFHAGRFEPEVVLAGLGERFEVEQVSIKPYPCCKYTHTAIAAALATRDDARFSLKDLERVIVKVPNREYFDVVCEPTDPVLRRQNVIGERGWVHAQFCMAYVIACALVRGRVTLGDFVDTARDDASVLDVMDLIEPQLSLQGLGEEGRVFPTPGNVALHYRDGTVIDASVDVAKGHPRNRMSFEEVAEKFRSVVAVTFPDRSFDALIDTVAHLEKAPDARAILDVMET